MKDFFKNMTTKKLLLLIWDLIWIFAIFMLARAISLSLFGREGMMVFMGFLAFVMMLGRFAGMAALFKKNDEDDKEDKKKKKGGSK